MGVIQIGIDIGQKHDPTAIAVVEEEERRGDTYFVVRRLERLPLGTPYPKVRERLADLVDGVQRRNAEGRMPAVYVDATGVGRPVVDELAGTGVSVTTCYFTHGDLRTKRPDRSILLGKAWLVSRLQVLLQNRRLLLPETVEARVLAKELQDYEIHVDEHANDVYGAFRVGTHDDLVTALGLATQESGRGGVWFVSMSIGGSTGGY